MEFHSNGVQPPPGYLAWFDAWQGDKPVVFGHWSARGLQLSERVAGLDTGCVWGGRLSAVRIDADRREMFHVDCAAAQDPPKRRPGPSGH